MPRTGWTPSIVPIVPYGADQTAYLVDSYAGPNRQLALRLAKP
jgi:hypothetical protein